MKRAKGIANLIQELLRRVQNYIFGVSLTLEAATGPFRFLNSIEPCVSMSNCRSKSLAVCWGVWVFSFYSIGGGNLFSL